MNAGTEGGTKCCFWLVIFEMLLVAKFLGGIFLGKVLKGREALRWGGVGWITVRQGGVGIVRGEAWFEQWWSLLIYC